MKKKLALGVLGLVILLALGLSRIKVERAVCTSQFGQCPSAVGEQVAEYTGTSYFSVKGDLANWLSQNPRIELFRIRFNLPGVLVVEVNERKPEVAADFGENRYFIFDKNGVNLGEVDQTELPTVSVYELPENSRFSFAMLLSRAIIKYYGASNLRLDKDGLYAVINGVETAFPAEGDIDVLLGSLEVSLSQLNEVREDSTISLPAGKNYKVDLRYRHPTISQI